MTLIRLPAAFARNGAASFLLGATLLGVAGMTGCAPKAASPEVMAATPDKVASLRDSIQKSKPGSLVGQVVATFELYAAVTEIPVKEVKLGETITFVDGNGDPVNNGTIARIVDDTLHVKFDPTGRRAVQKGDLAIWLKE